METVPWSVDQPTPPEQFSIWEGLGGQRKPRLGIHVSKLLRAETTGKVRATAGL